MAVERSHRIRRECSGFDGTQQNISIHRHSEQGKAKRIGLPARKLHRMQTAKRIAEAIDAHMVRSHAAYKRNVKHPMQIRWAHPRSVPHQKRRQKKSTQNRWAHPKSYTAISQINARGGCRFVIPFYQNKWRDVVKKSSLEIGVWVLKYLPITNSIIVVGCQSLAISFLSLSIRRGISLNACTVINDRVHHPKNNNDIVQLASSHHGITIQKLN